MVTLSSVNGDPHLTNREREILQLLVDGLTNREIAEKLFISPVTVKTHMRHIVDKLDAVDRRDAASIALERKLV